MKRKYYFFSKWFEKGTTWTVLVAFLFSQFNLFAAVAFLIVFFSPGTAQAARLGTSTVSAGSAPPPAATSVDSFQPDLFTGRASTGIPIAVPPGRKGVQPALGLSYSSSSRNGWIGVGWTLDLGYIERSTRKGVPKYDASDTFAFLFQNVNSDLVKLPDGTYRAKDEGLFARFENLGVAGWEVRDKSGTRYLFGQTAISRVANGTNIFRWNLDKVVDANGNSMILSYTTVDGLPYLSSIEYTGHDPTGLAPANRVDFTLQDRPDAESSYRSGFLLKTSKRLAAIETKATVSGSLSLAMRYELAYRQSQRTGRSLLAQVTQFGSNGSTNLPPVTFAYQDAIPPSYSIRSIPGTNGQVAWNVRVASWDNGHENIWNCTQNTFIDGPPYGSPQIVSGTATIGGISVSVYGDGSIHIPGRQDVAIDAWTYVFLDSAKSLSFSLWGSWDVAWMIVQGSSGGKIVCPANIASVGFDAGWSAIHLVGYNQNQGFSMGLGSDLVSQVRLMSPTPFTEPQLAGDVDGNGISDLIDFDPPSGTWRVSCAGNCVFSPEAVWLNGFGDGSQLPMLGDWNSDGRTDVGLYKDGIWRFATSTGTNFQADALPQLAFGSGLPATGDFNGDGFMDLATFSSGTWKVALGNGSTFNPQASFDLSTSPNSPHQQLTGDFNGDGLTDIAVLEPNTLSIWLSDSRTWQAQAPLPVSGFPTNVFTADFNGDGLTDLAYYDKSTGKIMVAYRTPTNFAAPMNLSSSLTFTQTSEVDQIQVADFNGDALPDPAVFNTTTGASELALSQGDSPDLLNGINNGLGGTTSISYRPASHLGNNFLPFLTPVVTETHVSDGLGNSYTNTYSYSQGLYDGPTKEFRGFGRVEVRDAEGNVSITQFHQDNVLKGRLYSTEFRDSLNRLFIKATNLWEAVQPYAGTDATFVRLAQTDSFTYDGNEPFKQTRSRMEYDAYGNVTASFADGDVAVIGDERSTTTTYTLNPTAWILNRPAFVQSLDADGNYVALRRFCYDNAPDPNIAPTKGNLTKEEEWLDQPVSKWIPTKMAYDAYGNVLRVTAALNRSVTNTYDIASRTFLVQVANPLGHTRTMVYDPRFGHVISSTDQNNVTTTSEYDPLGRITKVIGPLDTAALPTTRYEYDLSSNPVRVTQYTRVQSGQAQELVAHTFTDGLGRTIQARSPAQNPTKQVVTGTVEFDSKGRVVRQWTPYLDETSTSYRPHTLPAIASLLAPPVVHTYDALGRLLTTTDPDGSSTSIAYDDWTATTTDAKQHVKKRTSDAFGRLVQVQEFDGAGTNAALYATTTYQYDSRDNLILLTDAVGNTTSLEYDSLNRKIRMTDPDMGTWTYAYDDVDKLSAQTDARGVTINFAYDALNRQTNKSYTIPSGIEVPTNQPPVVYTYDNPLKQFSKGKLTEIADASGSSSFAYDTLGRLTNEVKVIDGTAYRIARDYDLLGRLTTLTYPNNDVAAYSYNDQGGIQTITLQSPAQPVQRIINSVDYNAAGQITKMVYGNGVTTDYKYNPQTLRLDKLKSVGPGGMLQDFTYSFDPVGNVSAIADAVHTASQTFTYDSLNRLATANGVRYGNFTYAYNQVGNMTGKEGVTQNYGALNNRPHAVTSTSSGLTLTYDADGNLASKSGPNRPTQLFSFDAENRLVEVTSPVPARRLDPGWNFVSFPQVVGEVPVTTVISNFAGNCEQLSRFNRQSNYFESFTLSSNQFTTVNSRDGYCLYVTNAAGTFVTFGDTPAPQAARQLPAGTNLLAGPAETMSGSNWLTGLMRAVDYSEVKGLNPSTGATVPVVTVRPGESYYVVMLRPAIWTPPAAPRIENPSNVRFVYDGDGGRVEKITSSGTTLFLGQSYEVSPTGQGTTFVFAGGQRIAAKDSTGNLRIYHSDHLGSANVITDQTGSSVEVTENTPYGSTSRLEGSVNVAHKFTGQRLDDETGLYFYNARYYDPEIGRFVQPDPVVQDHSDPQQLDHYQYARNNPVRYIDPSGHFIWAIIVAVVHFLTPIIEGVLVGAAINYGVNAIISALHIQGGLASALRAAGAAASAYFGGQIGGLTGKALTYSAQAGGLTSLAIDTPQGQKLVSHFAASLRHMGIGRDGAMIIASTLTTAAVNSLFYLGLATLSATKNTGVDYTDPAQRKKALEQAPEGKGQSYGGSSVKTILNSGSATARSGSIPQGIVASDIAFNDTPVLKDVFGLLNARHVAFVREAADSAQDSIPSYALIRVCHQAAINQVINTGAGGISALSAVAGKTGWTFFITSSLYGVQGTVLMQRIGDYVGEQATRETK